MARTVVITGAASGIGKATAERMRARGDRVIGVDLRDADIVADLATPDGRSEMVRGVQAVAPEGIDAIVAAAGVAAIDDPALTIAVNFFGAVATLDGLRPLLRNSLRPRAVAVLSTAALMDADATLVEACLSGDESAALDRARAAHGNAYMASKRALSLWLRAAATKPEWAGAGISLNGVAPGTVVTPMTAPLLATDEGRAILAQATPIVVQNYAHPEEIAEVLSFLANVESGYILGQTVFVDGGTDALWRPTTF